MAQQSEQSQQNLIVRRDIVRAYREAMRRRIIAIRMRREADAKRLDDMVTRVVDGIGRAQAARERDTATRARWLARLSGERDPDERERLADDREREADERERLADLRDSAANERDRLADARQRQADQRDREADCRDRVANWRDAAANDRDQVALRRQLRLLGVKAEMS